MSDLVDRFYTAVSVMTRDGAIKQKLVKAYEENLQSIEDDDLPASVRKPFAELRRMMKQVAPLNGEGATRATVRKMSGRDAERCAELMVALLVDLARHSDGAQRPLQGERPAVPPFLVKSG